MNILKEELPIIIICIKEIKKNLIEKLLAATDDNTPCMQLITNIRLINNLINKYDENLVGELIQTDEFKKELTYQIQQMITLEQFRSVKRLSEDIKIAYDLMKKINTKSL